MERLVPLRAADRSFDLAFWRRVGSAAQFEAAWQMVLDSMKCRGMDGGQPRLRKDVERLERMRRNKKAVGRQQDLLDLESLATARDRRPRASRR
jgi:hypothetical protein